MNIQKNKKFSTVIGKVFSIISNIISIVSWLGISGSVVLLFIYKNVFLIIPIIVGVLTIVIIHLCKVNRVSIIKRVFNMFAYNMQYSFDEWIVQYEYHSPYKMSFYTTYMVKALQTGVDHIRVRFNWSGATETNPIKPLPACEDDYQSDKIVFFHREYGYLYYKLYSKNTINRNDKPIKMGVKLENLEDNAKKASPHLLTSVSVVTKVLKMRVILPINMRPEDIHCLEYLHSTDDFHWRDLSNCYKLEKIANKWHIIWDVDKPVFGGKYIMSWKPNIT